ESLPELRECVRVGVSRGISHVLAPTAAAGLLRGAADPAVKQRIEHLLLLPTGLDEADVETTVLRAAVALGVQRIGGVIHPGIPDPVVWARLEARRAEGVIHRLGVRLDHPADLDRLPARHIDGWLV